MYARFKSEVKHRINRFLDQVFYKAACRAIDNALKGYASNLHKTITTALEDALDLDASNLRRQLKREAVRSSASYLIESVPLECRFDHRDQLLDHCAREAPAHGLLLEFGVFSGQSIRHLAAC